MMIADFVIQRYQDLRKNSEPRISKPQNPLLGI